MTEPERRLWTQLRRRQIAGARFRRQVPIGPFVIDFGCIERRLVIEIDGETHARTDAYDRRRSEYLAAEGWRVLRFTNDQVMREMAGVLQSIAGALRPHPNPPPHAGEGVPRRA
jgi:adenine-specific DNA-methyltransferase